jgi:hypothetical protein
MPKISRENTLVRKVSLVVISTAEKKIAKTEAFDWLRFAISQRSRNYMNSTIPGEEKYFEEKHYKLIMFRMRSNFSHEIFRISLVVELIYDLLCFASNIIQ